MLPYRVDFSALSWESPMPGVRHKVAQDASRRLRLVEYSSQMAPHWCDRGHCGHILQGTFEIEFATQMITFQSGDGVFIPSGEAHRHRARVLSDIVTAIFVEDVALKVSG